MIRVLKIKDIIKYILIIIVIAIFIMIANTIKSDAVYLNCINSTILEINALGNESKTSKPINIAQTLITSEIKVGNNLKNNTNINGENITNNENSEPSKEEISNTNENESNQENETAKANDDAKVTEVNNSGVNPKTTNEYQGVKINNGTNYELTNEMLNPDISVNKNKIGIYHTHTCESYTTSEKYSYEQNGNYRTTDLNFTVARVGDELTNQLQNYGCNVIHSKNYHDYPAYTGSYSRSLKTAEEIKNDNQDIDIMIDLHRDAIGDENYAPKVKIGDEYVSQLMFVMGSNEANPINSNWNQNLKFAIKVQEKGNELYPGLFKPIILRNSEYNQHISKASCIIEVGATGNTLDESIGSMKYLAKIIEEL